MSARSGTSGIIWLAIVLIAASIATSAMGLFMDSWRTSDGVEDSPDGMSASSGLTTFQFEFDLKEFYDGDAEGECEELLDEVEEDEDDVEYECADKNTLISSQDFSDLCEEADDAVKDAEDAGQDTTEIVDERNDVCDTADAGQKGSIFLWVGFGVAIIALILSLVTAISGDSGSRKSAGLMMIFAGLLMPAAVVIWANTLPSGIGGEDNDWDAGLNVYLTIVGGVLAVVAGIIALLAGRKGDQSFAAPMHSMQQQFQEQQFQQQQYYQQPQQQQYQQPEPYQQW